MKCRDFAQGWNDLLDRRESAAGPAEATLIAHAQGCPTCLPLLTGYAALRRALSAPPASRSVPQGLPDRVLTALDRPGTERDVWVLPLRSRVWAAAALVLIAAGLGLRAWTRPGAAVGPVALRTNPSPSVEHRSADLRDLPAALAEAGSATWHLAREASAPVRRVGREVLGPVAWEGASRDLGLPQMANVSFPTPPTSGVLRRVTERVNAGSGPLSGSARHAFSFLLSPALNRRPGAVIPRRGA